MQVLHWTFSDRFDTFCSDSCCIAGRPVSFRYIDDISDECYHGHEGLLVREPPGEPLVVGLRRDLDASIAELTAAHELVHERLITVGYPLVYADLDMVSPLASAYSSVLSDPTIDRYLFASDYDVRPLLRRDLNRLKLHAHNWAACIPFSDPEAEVELLRWMRLALAPSNVGLEGLERLGSADDWKLIESLRAKVRELGYETPNGQYDALEFLLKLSSASQLLHVFSPVVVNTLSPR